MVVISAVVSFLSTSHCSNVAIRIFVITKSGDHCHNMSCSFSPHENSIQSCVLPLSQPIKEKTRGVQTRVKFGCIHQGSDPKIQDEEWKPLAKALAISEDSGAAPVDEHGRIHGNGAIFCGDSIIVSKSGRLAGTTYDAGQFVRVSAFDFQTWTVDYSSADPTAKPSSDLPLLWYAMKIAPDEFEWIKRPNFVLHGHTCKTEAEANLLGVPCSTKETLFSTPEDLDALIHLFIEFSYPDHQIFVRLNHGFFLLADTPEEAIHLFETKLESAKFAEKPGLLSSPTSEPLSSSLAASSTNVATTKSA